MLHFPSYEINLATEDTEDTEKKQKNLRNLRNLRSLIFIRLRAKGAASCGTPMKMIHETHEKHKTKN